jgi:uncharacterized membrane protein YgcG
MDDVTPLDLSHPLDRFALFAAMLLWMNQEPEPGSFCLCRLDRDSPACKRRRMQGRTLRRQQRPCGRPLAPRAARARHSHTGGAHGAGGGDSGGGDDGGGGSPCDICGEPVCLTPRFCNICRLSDSGRLIFLFRGRR